MNRYLVCAIVAVLLECTGVPGQEDGPPGQAAAAKSSDIPVRDSDFSDVEAIAGRVRDSVVVISAENRDGRQQGVGTGFVVDEEGLIATNLHVIGEGRPIQVTRAAGGTLEVTAVEASDHVKDLAVLRVNTRGKQLPALDLAEADSIRLGEPIVMMGNPHGLRHSVVAGVVSARREIEGRRMIQLAVPIEPGNSGGPVLDGDGRVIGIATMKSAVTDNLGFAVEVSELLPLLSQPNPVPLARWLRIGGVDPQRWEPLFGANWRQRVGRVEVEGTGAGFGGRSLCLRNEDVPEPPFEVAVSVKLDDESGAAGLVFHADGADQHYGFYPSNGRMRLSCFRGPSVFSWQVLDEVSTPHYQPGEWNDLRVRIEEDKLRCFVNGQLVFESTDRQLRSGRVGLAKFRQTKAEFRQFAVGKSLKRQQLDETEAAGLRETIDRLPALSLLTDEQLAPLAEQAHAGESLLREQADAFRERADELDRLAAAVHLRRVTADLAELVAGDEEGFDLLRAALLIAQLDDADVRADDYLDEVDRMAGEIRATLAKDAGEATRLDALNRYLFQQNGFHGSRFDYYHSANSHLDRVIDDREGLPITLSVLYMELGRRLGLKIEGVGLPGHFVVRFVPGEGAPQLIDVFAGGVPMSREDAAAKVRAITGQPLVDDHLKPASRREIVSRMLRNLLGLAEAKGDRAAMLRYIEGLAAVDPQSIQHRGMRALLRYQNGRRTAAVADLDWIIDRQPPGLDLDQLRQMRARFQQAGR